MNQEAERKGAREIRREGRAGDVPWSAVIYDHDGDYYEIAQVHVAGKPLRNRLPDRRFDDLDTAIIAIKASVTGAFPSG